MAEQIDVSGDGGVLKEILKEGEGSETPGDGCNVRVHYTGMLLDGTKFDSSVDRKEPFEFSLGKGQVIRSWDVGIATMKKGEKCVLTCAPNYAYGAAGSPPNIPPNSTLKFEVEMLGWKGQDLSKNGDGGIERYIVTKSDKKKTPNDGAFVKCHITGRYEDRIFEDRDIEFNLGEGEDFGVISGVETALEKMTQGETSRLVIKPKYAFGSEGNEQFKVPPKAVVEYTVTLNDFEKAVESWKLDKDESLEQSKIFKDKGTKYFKQDKIKMALKFYEKCHSFLSNCDTSTDNEAKALSLSVYLNKALCHQKLDDLDEVRHACDEALGLDPKNVKALYRRGQAHLTLGETEKALADFEAVHEIEPDNKAAINQIAICKQKIKQYQNEEKARYKNMFSRFAAADGTKERIQALHAPDVMANTKFGEWREEERDHEITSFERENPDILMCQNEYTEVLKNM